ncbi:MAG: MFS transporter, partial [Planctomycetota bacterium]
MDEADPKPTDRPAPKGSGKVLAIVFLTVFLDMVGFSIIFPLFPDMLDHYVGREGAESAIGRLAAWLTGVAGDDDFAVIALFGGILGSLYSGTQFLFAPVWGAVSDRVGRRRTLLVTLAGTAASYVLWLYAGSFAVLVVARLVGGIMAGNISVASAAIADTHSGSARAKGMGLMGAGIGLGFVVGPALGGWAAGWTADWGADGSGDFALNPFSGPAALALGLAIVNWAAAAARFGETRAPRTGVEVETLERRGLNPSAALRRLAFPGVHALNVAYFVYFAAFGAMEFTLVFLAKEHLGYGPRDNALMFVFIGLTIAFVQGGVVRRLVPRLGERKVAFAGMAATVPGFCGIAAVTHFESAGVLYASLFLVAAGSSLVMPSLSSLASRYVPEDRQGFALGVFRSFGSLARVIGPFAGGVAYYGLGSWAPYVAAAAIALVPT